MRKRLPTSPVGLLVLAIVIIVPATAQATFYANRQHLMIPATDTVADDIYLVGKEAVVDGVIAHDLCAACERYTISGEVQGSVNSASQNAGIRGIVGNSARIFAQNAVIDGQIGNNLMVFASDIQIGKSCRVARFAGLFGGQVSVAGQIDGNLRIRSGDVIISGIILGDVDIVADKISIAAPSQITGKLTYKSKKEITIDEGATITGGVERLPQKSDEEKDNEGISWPWEIALFLCSLVTGLILIAAFNHHARLASDFIVSRSLVALGIGFIAFCMTPIAIMVLLITVVGIPAAVILLFMFTVFFYIAKIYVAISLGKIVNNAFRKGFEIKLGWALSIGLVILAILFNIPFLGRVVYFVTIFWGIGAILLGFMECRRLAAQPAAPQSTA
jgi:cytoskeletal protein CcmA (bactofilin family)